MLFFTGVKPNGLHSHRLLFHLLRQNARRTFWDNREINIYITEKENKSTSRHVYAPVLCLNVFPGVFPGLRSWFKAVVVKPLPTYHHQLTPPPHCWSCVTQLYSVSGATRQWNTAGRTGPAVTPPESASRRWIIQQQQGGEEHSNMGNVVQMWAVWVEH